MQVLNFEQFDSEGYLTLYGKRLVEIIDERKIQGPTYLYSEKGFSERLKIFKSSFDSKLGQNISLHFAMKSNSHPHILKMVKSHGYGVDIVSGGELRRALECGFRSQDIVYSGVGKTVKEIEFALDLGVGQFNVESLSELRRINHLASQRNQVASIVLRLNPNVDAKTHPYIATGIFDNKFGLNEDQFTHAVEIFKTSSSVKFVGISCHIGSQILDISVFRESLQFQRRIFEQYRSQGFPLQIFNIGGGLGIDYQESSIQDLVRLERYSSLVAEEVSQLDALIQFEPGRFLIARYGILLTQVEYIKMNSHKNFLICNSGMNHLLRPALYGAKHRIIPLRQKAGVWSHFDVVGPVCESSDFFAKNAYLPPIDEGDWLCVLDTGAYGAVMASHYNLFDLPTELIIEES